MGTNGLILRPFQAGDEAAFRDLNEAWIQEYFTIETKDIEILHDPVTHVLNPGGHILMALDSQYPVGCCALLRKSEKTFELGKMAVLESRRGSGIGRRLLAYVIEYARTLNAVGLYLESSRKLPNALRLYESMGFRHIPPERIERSPYARSDVHMELTL